MEQRTKLNNVWKILLVGRYVFSIVITAMAFRTIENWQYILISLLELMGIISVSYLILVRCRKIGQIVHFVLLLIYNVQIIVMYFGGSFVSMIMLTNLSMFQDLYGKFGEYIRLIIPLVFFSFVPANPIIFKKARPRLVVGIIVCEVILLIVLGSTYSPICNIFHVYSDWREHQHMSNQVSGISSDGLEFYSEEVEQYFGKPVELSQNPNVVLIFIEGLSENIICDERNIMPNLQKLQSESLRFENYYNHTCATFRGLIGQLYSGYQLNNTDTNRLISVQSILKDRGYKTTFINTEPSNESFTAYLEDFQFDNLLTDIERQKHETGLYDKDAFELLYDTLMEQHKEDAPFFTAIYTFGTHTSLDSPDKQYQDGTNALLNKFYNTDYYLGEFIEKFKESELYEDTILIVTTDHATYVDEDFLNTFPDYEREFSFLDRIPFFIYHKEVQADAIDVAGRNSLDLIPTILDYLDVSAPNYFLGRSLFSLESNKWGYDTVFTDVVLAFSTKHNEIRQLEGKEYDDFKSSIVKYYAAKGDRNTLEIGKEKIETTVSEDDSTLSISLKSDDEYKNMWFVTWSDEGNQDDIAWYKAALDEGIWKYDVNLSKHNSTGTYYIHAYVGTEKPELNIAQTGVYVANYPKYHINTEMSDDFSTITISVQNIGEYTDIRMPIWSAENGQDDIDWYTLIENGDGSWTCTINTKDHFVDYECGELLVHVYGKLGQEGEEECLREYTLNFSVECSLSMVGSE